MLDKRIIVTGGTYGMGAAIVRALVDAGATIACMARSADLGQRQATELSAKGPGAVKFHRCDVSIRPQVKSAFAAAVRKMGGLTAWSHVPGLGGGARPGGEGAAAGKEVLAVTPKARLST